MWMYAIMLIRNESIPLKFVEFNSRRRIFLLLEILIHL